MSQRIGVGNYSGGAKADDNLHFKTDAEVLFTGTGTTDGGLRITARVELEADSGGDQIDENWLSIEGNFGRVTLGGEDSAAITHGYVGIGGGFGNIGYYDSSDTWTPVGSDIYPIGYGDYQGIRYSTPSVSGFSGAVSFQPKAADGAGSAATDGDNDHSIFSAGGSYSTSMGPVNLTVGGGMLAREKDPDGNPSTDELGGQWGIGLEVGMGSNTLYLRRDVFGDEFGENLDWEGWGVQVARSIGGTTVSVGYSRAKAEGEGTAGDETTSKIVAGANYSLGGGTTVGAAAAWGKVDDEGGPDVSGTSFGAHIAFSF